jgi:hypothetical protein
MRTEDVDLKDTVGMQDAAKLIRGKGGKHCSVRVLYRWSNPDKGYRPRMRPDVPAVILQTVIVNGERLTTKQWIEEFERARVAAGVPRKIPASERTRSKRSFDAAQKRAGKTLDAMGCK